MRTMVQRTRTWTAAVGVLLVGCGSARAEIRLPKVFGSHMVLQCDQKLPVWGWGDPGERATISIGANEASTVANDRGEWRVDLPPLPAGGPHVLTATGSNTVRLDDVMVGEVWLCSGQSNMAWTVSGSNDAQAEIAAADHPGIRLFLVPRKVSGVALPDVDAAWQVCSPQTIPGFSAVAYFFGRELRKELGVPVGLIVSAWGGTRIEPWTPPAGFARVPRLQRVKDQLDLATPSAPAYKERLQRYVTEIDEWLATTRQALADETAAPAHPAYPSELRPLTGTTSPSSMYRAMIHPLVPFAIRGAIWYQGESNRRDGSLYQKKMRALVEGWRTVWGQGYFPFCFVQLAPFVYSEHPSVLPKIWEAQLRAAQEIPNCGMVVTNDIGNIKDIHPRNKQDVGKRLALWPLSKTYGRSDTVCSGPWFKGMSVESNQARITFDHADNGLAARDDQPLTWFEVRGHGADFVKADAVIDGSSVLVSSSEVAQPVGVRFAWHETAEPNLINKEGLPAAAFRAGDLPPPNDLIGRIPEARNYTSVYVLDIPDDPNYNDKPVEYTVDRRTEVTEPFDRVAYCLELQKKDEDLQYVFVSMDAFTNDTGRIGVPTVAAKGLFQQDVSNLDVASNVPGVPRVTGSGGGNIEFWPSSYGPKNERPVRDASDDVFDFGDSRGQSRPGYGSMQVHDHEAKVTLLAFNRWGPKGTCELGIGNSPTGNPDWTFLQNAGQYVVKRLTVLVRLDL